MAAPEGPRGVVTAKQSRFGRILFDGRGFVPTFAGRPLYYYVGDRKAGQILCQNVTEFGGVWRVVRPDGSLVG